MTRILVLGATGSVGTQLTKTCLDTFPEGTTLILYARSPQKLAPEIANNRQVIVIKGELEDSTALSMALEGVDAVLSTLGPNALGSLPWATFYSQLINVHSPFAASGTPIAKAYSNLFKLMRASSVSRIIALGTTSGASPRDGSDWRYTAMIAAVSVLSRQAYKEFVAIGKVFSEEADGLDWTIARVPVLTNDKGKEYVTGYVGDSKLSIFVSKAAFAAFCVSELEGRKYLQEMPVISSP